MITCSNCAFPNPAAANFCQNCGQRLQPAAGAPGATTTGERRVVTVLFCDVAGSTTLAEGLDPEEWVEIMNGAFPHLISPVYHYEGVVARLLGDAILAFFGAPIAHEDDAQRAVLAGLEILSGVSAFREQVRARRGLDFDVRIGINTGLMYVGEVGSNLRLEYTAMGDAVNLAARMEQTAAPGTIQISEYTYRRVAPYFEVEALGAISVKGKQEPVAAYRVLGARPDPAQARGIDGLSTPLVGRARELALLREVLSDLRVGRGAIVCMMAEAGLGKTRLISELRAEVDTVLWSESRGLSYERMRPYGLFQQQLRSMCAIPPDAAPDVIRERIAATLGNSQGPVAGQAGTSAEAIAEPHTVRLLARLLGVEEKATGKKTWPEGEELKNELFAVMSDFCRLLARRQPLMLVFDDLHWADESSVAMLEHLFRLTDDVSITFICAFRPHREAPVWRLRQAADRNFPHRTREVILKSLTRHESSLLVDGLLRSPSLPPQLEQLILEKAEGNPFFVEETVRGLIEARVLVRDATPRGAGPDGDRPEGERWRVVQQVQDIAIPDTLQALLTARIDRLEEAQRRTLQLASVIGRMFSARVLKMISTAPQEVDGHLVALQRVGLIQEEARLPEPEYSFRHGLTQDAAYASILLRDRRTYHRSVGRALEQAGNLDELASMLGHHFAEAGDAQRAAGYFERAGDRAASVYANAEAVSFYTRAIELQNGLQLPDETSATGPHRQQSRDLYRQRGRVNEILGRFEEALADYRAGLELAHRDHDLRAESQALLDLGFLWASRDYGQAGDHFHEALDKARRLESPAILAHCLNRVGNWYINASQPQQAQQYHQEALSILQEVGDREGLAETYDLLGLALSNGAQLFRGVVHYERAIALFRELGDRQALASSLATMTSMCAVHQLREIFPAVRKFPQVVDYGDEALELARAIGWRAREAFAQASRSNLFTAGGDYVRAVAAGQEGLALAEQIGHRQWLCSANWTMGCILLDLFDLAGARRHLEEGLALAEATRSQLWLEFVVGILAHILVLQGELEQAGAVLQRCYQSDERPVSAGARMVWRAAAEHALACGEAARALALVDQLLAYTIEDDGFAPEMPVGLHVLRGNVLAALGRTGEAETELQEARQTAVQYYAPNSQWRVHAALARLYTAQGEQEQAAHHSAAAQNLLAGLAPNVPPELKEQFARGVRSLSV